MLSFNEVTRVTGLIAGLFLITRDRSIPALIPISTLFYFFFLSLSISLPYQPLTHVLSLPFLSPFFYIFPSIFSLFLLTRSLPPLLTSYSLSPLLSVLLSPFPHYPSNPLPPLFSFTSHFSNTLLSPLSPSSPQCPSLTSPCPPSEPHSSN